MSGHAHPKLAFDGHGASIYTYVVIPSGPVNGPVISSWMVFNINREWQVMAVNNCVVINVDTNTKTIVSNCFNWAISKNEIFFMWKLNSLLHLREGSPPAFPSCCSSLHMSNLLALTSTLSPICLPPVSLVLCELGPRLLTSRLLPLLLLLACGKY